MYEYILKKKRYYLCYSIFNVKKTGVNKKRSLLKKLAVPPLMEGLIEGKYAVKTAELQKLMQG